MATEAHLPLKLPVSHGAVEVCSLQAQGFTLLEVLISAAIGMILLLSTLSVFDTANAARGKLMRSNETFQSARFALETMESDLQLAGFYGEGAIPTALPATLPDPCTTASASWLTALRLPIQGYFAGDSAVPSCVPSALVAGSPVLALRRAATCQVGAANCASGSAGTPMIQLSQCQTDGQMVATSTDQATLTLHGLNCTAAGPIRQYYTHIYFLASDNVSGDGVPTLKRLELTSSGMVQSTVAQGVEQLRLLYGIDSDNNGIADIWTTTPATANACSTESCAILNWSNVLEAKLHILARGTQTEPGYVSDKRFVLGDLAVPAANDNFHRRLLSSHIRIENVAAPRTTN